MLPTADRERPGTDFGFVVMLMSAMAAGTAITSTIGVLSPQLVRHFEIGPAAFGWLPATMYGSAVVFSGPVGRAVDRLGAGGVAVTAIATSLLAVLAFAVAVDFWMLFVAMAVGGGILAAANPATNSLIAHHVRPGGQGTLMGVKQAGATLMPVYVGFVAPALAARFGWRWAAFGVAPVIVVMLTNAWRSNRRLPAKDERGTPAGEAPELDGRSMRPIHDDAGRATPSWTYPLRVYVAALGFAMSIANNFYVLYATSSVGTSEAVAGAMIGVMGVFSVIARIGWARLGERLPADVPLLLWIGVAGVASTLVVVSADQFGAGAMWFGVILTGATIFGWNALAMLVIVRLTTTEAVGEASGTVVLPMFIGLAVGPAVFGAVVEHLGYSAGWGLQTLVTGVAAVAAHMLYRRLGNGD